MTYLSGASRTAKCRQKKSDDEKEETNERAKLGMRESRKRNKEMLASEGETVTDLKITFARDVSIRSPERMLDA